MVQVALFHIESDKNINPIPEATDPGRNIFWYALYRGPCRA